LYKVMERWEKQVQDCRKNSRRENPSFSSTLLDAIYRSIDAPTGKGEEELNINIYRSETMRKKHSSNGAHVRDHAGKEEMLSLQRACLIEKWMEKKVNSEKVVLRRKSMANELERKQPAVLLNSSSSSSESSCGGGFSSSESDSFHGAKSKSSNHNNNNNNTTQRAYKPIRTSISTTRPERFEYHNERNYTKVSTQKGNNSKHEGDGGTGHTSNFIKTKSKAMKIYNDLKKVKQPISPGGRLATFLNSLFTAGNMKKPKINVSSPSKSGQTSTCSSASSFSRSCLSKTPSSRGKLSNGTKRSVRFCPVSVIVDEDCRPCGQKNLYETDQHQNRKPTMDEYNIMEENRRVVEAARDLLRSYHKKKEEFDIREICNIGIDQQISDNDDEEEDEDEDEDAASCASSDLFELDSLSAVGIDRYRQELPVYETTHLGSNRAIANGLIL
ncbi:hypothetical protein CFOL_v3_28389, partial [Cephalotus follicularis]